MAETSSQRRKGRYAWKCHTNELEVIVGALLDGEPRPVVDLLLPELQSFVVVAKLQITTIGDSLDSNVASHIRVHRHFSTSNEPRRKK